MEIAFLFKHPLNMRCKNILTDHGLIVINILRLSDYNIITHYTDELLLDS